MKDELKELVQKSIAEIESNYPFVTIKYEFDPHDSLHIIDLGDFDYMNSESWVILENKLMNILTDNFPYEGFLFVNSKSLVRATCPSYVTSFNQSKLFDGFDAFIVTQKDFKNIIRAPVSSIYQVIDSHRRKRNKWTESPPYDVLDSAAKPASSLIEAGFFF